VTALPDRDLSRLGRRRRPDDDDDDDGTPSRDDAAVVYRLACTRETDKKATNTRGYSIPDRRRPIRQTNKSRTHIIIYEPPTILYTAAAACCSYRREILLNTRPGALQKRGWPRTILYIYT